MTRKAALKSLRAIARLRGIIRYSGDSLARKLARRPAAASDARPDVPAEGRAGALLDAPVGAGADYRSSLAHLNAELDAAEEELTTAEDRLALRLARFAGLQQERAYAKRRLYLRQNRIRKLFAGLADAGSVRACAGLTGATAQAAPRLVRQAWQTVEYLRRLERASSQPIAGLTLDCATLADDLTTDLLDFRAASADIAEARSGVIGSRGRADQAIATADHVVSCVARTLESLSRLADQPVLAERIRVAARR